MHRTRSFNGEESRDVNRFLVRRKERASSRMGNKRGIPDACVVAWNGRRAGKMAVPHGALARRFQGSPAHQLAKAQPKGVPSHRNTTQLSLSAPC